MFNRKRWAIWLRQLAHKLDPNYIGTMRRWSYEDGYADGHDTAVKSLNKAENAEEGE